MNIALKESAETNYWLRLLYATNYLTQEEFSSIFPDSEEITKLLIAITKSAKQ